MSKAITTAPAATNSTQADLSRIVQLCEILGSGHYAAMAKRYQAKLRDALELRNDRLIEQADEAVAHAEVFRGALEQSALWQDELATLARKHLPETAKQCPLIRKLTHHIETHYYEVAGFDWAGFDKQCRDLEIDASHRLSVEPAQRQDARSVPADKPAPSRQRRTMTEYIALMVPIKEKDPIATLAQVAEKIGCSYDTLNRLYGDKEKPAFQAAWDMFNGDLDKATSTPHRKSARVNSARRREEIDDDA